MKLLVTGANGFVGRALCADLFRQGSAVRPVVRSVNDSAKMPYNRTVRYDWLAHHLFETVDEVQQFATEWLWTYNHVRPNMALGGMTSKQKLALAA
ncbi:MAG: integrase core domain-containing protein [Methylotenera sp.]|nr:integrase core domain-containing protein [Methylotenera sp.]